MCRAPLLLLWLDGLRWFLAGGAGGFRTWWFCGSYRAATEYCVEFGDEIAHTAPHVDINIPLLRLPEAQRELESRFSGKVLVQAWSWRGYVENCRQCQLYDYERRRWLNFDGKSRQV
jgi:hypothetical protein